MMAKMYWLEYRGWVDGSWGPWLGRKGSTERSVLRQELSRVLRGYNREQWAVVVRGHGRATVRTIEEPTLIDQYRVREEP